MVIAWMNPDRYRESVQSMLIRKADCGGPDATMLIAQSPEHARWDGARIAQQFLLLKSI